MSLFAHRHVVPNLYEFISFVEHKRYFEDKNITWRWLNDDWSFIFGWTIPLRKCCIIITALIIVHNCLSSCLRTDALLVKLSMLVGQSVFYGALWGSVLICPLVRLPASLFSVAHFDHSVTAREQKYMLGTDHRLVVSVYSTLQTYFISSQPVVWFILHMVSYSD